MIKKVAIYCRVSTREQIEYGFSIIDQEKKLLDFCVKKHDIDIENILVFRDGKSAENLERKSMTDLIQMIQDGRISKVFIHNLDRLIRDLDDFMNIQKLLAKHSVELISLREELTMDTAMKKYQVKQSVLMSEWELNTIKERTIRGVDRSAEEGNYSKGGKPPFGYNKKNKKIIINSEESEIVMFIFQLAADKNQTPLKIAKYLRVNFSSVSNWSEDNIRKILNNKIYIGTFTNGRVSITNHSPRIISDELFSTVQSNFSTRRKKNHYNYIFANIVTCKQCKILLSKTCGTSKNGSIHLYYKCSSCKRSVSQKKMLNDFHTITHKKVNYSEEDNQLKKHLKSLSKELDRYDLLLYDNEITISEYISKFNSLGHRKLELMNQRIIRKQKEIERTTRKDIKSKFTSILYDFESKTSIFSLPHET